MKRESEQEVDKLEAEVKQEANEEEKGSDAEDKPQAPGFKKYPPKCRIAIIAGYNGTNFSGSQK